MVCSFSYQVPYRPDSLPHPRTSPSSKTPIFFKFSDTDGIYLSIYLSMDRSIHTINQFLNQYLSNSPRSRSRLPVYLEHCMSFSFFIFFLRFFHSISSHGTVHDKRNTHQILEYNCIHTVQGIQGYLKYLR